MLAAAARRRHLVGACIAAWIDVTNELVRKAWTLIQEVERLGGRARRPIRMLCLPVLLMCASA